MRKKDDETVVLVGGFSSDCSQEHTLASSSRLSFLNCLKVARYSASTPLVPSTIFLTSSESP